MRGKTHITMPLSQEQSHNPLTRRIMRKVYTVWFVRTVAPRMTGQLCSFLVGGYVLHALVAERIIVQGMRAALGQGVGSFVLYTRHVFVQTDVVNQVLVGGLVFVALLMLRELRNAFRALRQRKSFSVNAARNFLSQ